jgi:2,5-diamino-6-(ribosylamino)-4(3H)-pyrimidinone 5'-phosphate reductase
MPATENPPARPRPEVLVNCAVSLDGRLAFAGGRRARLSGPEDLARVQRLRAGVDAIVVGVGTVLLDDPSLRVHWELIGGRNGPEPMRVVLDSTGRTPASSRVLDGAIPTLVVTSERSERHWPPGVRTLRAGRTTVELDLLWEALDGQGVRRVLVEGGATVLANVLRSGTFDRLTVYVAPVLIGGRTAPPLMLGPECPGEEAMVRLHQESAEPLGEGVLLTLRPRPAPRTG